MTDNRAKIAFKLNEPVIWLHTGKRYYIKGIETERRERRSLADRLNVRDEIVNTFVIKEDGCAYHVKASELAETREQPAEEFQTIILMNLAGL